MFCSACGTKNVPDSNFCRQCGHKLEKTEPPDVKAVASERALPEDEQVSALLERAYRLRKEDSSAAAISLCEAALRLRPESTSAHSLLGQLYERSGDRERAIREYERVLQLNPGSIADRVKLDEMRGGAAAPRGDSSTPFAVAEQTTPRQEGRALLALGLAMVLLLMLVGAMALQIRSHTDQTAADSGSRQGVALASPSGDTIPAQPALPNGRREGDSSTPANTGSPHAAAPVIGSDPVSFGLYPPAYFVYPSAPSTPRTVYIPVDSRRHNTSLAAVLPAVTQPRHTASASQDDGSVRVRLSDDVTSGSDTDHHIVIPVPTPDGKNKSSNAADIQIVRSASPDTNTGDTEITSAASSGSQSLIVVANDQKKRGDYVKAIKAYQQALSGAGDEAGYIYQQIGYCFQQRGDKNSAITNYQRAISEYQKHSQTEAAQDGIRVCEQGIKICSGE